MTTIGGDRRQWVSGTFRTGVERPWRRMWALVAVALATMAAPVSGTAETVSATERPEPAAALRPPINRPWLRYQTIGLMGAFDGEVAHLASLVTSPRRVIIAQKEFTIGRLAGHRVVVVLSGVGLINAAHTTQILIDRFGVDTVFFTGSAAPLVPDIGVLDSVISTETQQFTMDFRPLFPLGEVPFLRTSVFPSDPDLVELATRVAATIPGGTTVAGKILSGDRLAPAAGTEVLLQGIAVESEGAAVGQVCNLNGVPYVVIRTMSNTLADPNEFEKYQAQAALRSQQIALKMLQSIRRPSRW